MPLEITTFPDCSAGVADFGQIAFFFAIFESEIIWKLKQSSWSQPFTAAKDCILWILTSKCEMIIEICKPRSCDRQVHLCAFFLRSFLILLTFSTLVSGNTTVQAIYSQFYIFFRLLEALECLLHDSNLRIFLVPHLFFSSAQFSCKKNLYRYR